MTRSRHIPAAERLACAVGMALGMTYELRKELTAAQLLSCIDWHHAVVPVAEGGAHEHWNLEPRWKPEHRVETRTKTVPAIAKGNDSRRAAQAVPAQEEPVMQQLVARIKRSSDYWGQTEPNAWFDVRVVGDRSYRLRGNGNNYRLRDVALGVRLDDGSIVDLTTGAEHRRSG